ncbi:hypothetical protein T10_10631 [Trichinella papuae]|uniref:Uncharacterized protein n=1 Tax=Trichinella papuae TaxID=268474 RepID=A0A0V1M024_9BILA|nr:hypothetical protein T10_10631 [Trichinella papuae]
MFKLGISILIPTGNSLFHISLINVSYRIRGKVDRDMITLLMNISVSIDGYSGNNMVLNKTLSRMIIPYSAMNRRANSTLENSMLKPLTSSLSASAKSKGLRLVSARIIIVAGIVAYFLFDTQPLRTIPNLMIPIKVIMNSRFAWNLIGLNVSGSPHQKSMNRVSISFNPSKIGCISPMIIALFGPSRRWLMPMYCRSIRVTKATDRRIVMVMASRLVAHSNIKLGV